MAIINFRFVICICYWQFAIENQKSEIGIGKSKSAIGKLTSFGLKEKTAVVMFWYIYGLYMNKIVPMYLFDMI